jgi:hypothetical protein
VGLKELLELGEKIKSEVEGTFQDEIKSSISAIGSVIDSTILSKLGIHPVYASSPITTGYALWLELEKKGAKSFEELKLSEPDIRKRLMKQNIEDGIAFGDEVRTQGYPIVIVPGIFFAKNWTQEHYMGLWEPVITQYAEIIVYNDNFHYSDGCVEEFLIGLTHDKKLCGRKGLAVLNPKDEIIKIENAMNHMEKISGITPTKMFNNYKKICTLI